MKLNFDGGLITIEGTNNCLGDLLENQGAVFDPSWGRVDVTPEQAKEHNRVLAKCLIDGLDKCDVGLGQMFYITEDNRVTTWGGELVGENVSKKKTEVVVHRGEKVFKGKRRKNTAAIFLARVK
jgi:hypothetical protein